MFSGRVLCEACAWFLPDVTQKSFPFDNFALYHLTVINLAVYDMLGLVSTSTKLLNLAWSWGPRQRHLNNKFDELQEGEC